MRVIRDADRPPPVSWRHDHRNDRLRAQKRTRLVAVRLDAGTARNAGAPMSREKSATTAARHRGREHLAGRGAAPPGARQASNKDEYGSHCKAITATGVGCRAIDGRCRRVW